MLGGCYPHFAPTTPVTPDEMPTKTSAYLYGRFALDTADDLQYAFVIGCEDGNEYQIPFAFLEETTVVAIKVAPSTCTLRGALFVKGTNVYKRKDDIEQYMLNIKLVAGTAYYLGDFTVKASEPMGWEIEKIDDKYKNTTQELKTIWRHFATMRTEKRAFDDAIHVLSSGSAADHEREMRLVPCLDKEWKCRDSCANGTGQVAGGCFDDCAIEAAECKRQLKDRR